MKVYICHYHKLVERIEYLKNQFKEKNINYEIVCGKDRNNLTKEDYSIFSNDLTYNKNRIDFSPKRGNYNILNDSESGVAANFLTHIEIWKKILNGDEEYSVVLEDDAIFVDNYTQHWDKAMNTFPENLDIAYLHEGCGFTIENKLGLERNVDKIWYNCNIKETRTCCSYIISKKFCKKLLDNLYPIVLGVDHELNYLQQKLNANVYWTAPAIFYEGSGSNYQSSLR
jgi:GR25 family glycosyltransferase involved in LPS biosynthesis